VPCGVKIRTGEDGDGSEVDCLQSSRDRHEILGRERFVWILGNSKSNHLSAQDTFTRIVTREDGDGPEVDCLWSSRH